MVYKFIEETDSKIIGKVDGSAAVIRETNTLTIYDSMKENMPVKNDVKLDCFKIQDKARLLDVLSAATAYNTTGLLVSEKFKTVISSLNLHNAQFIPVDAEYKGAIISSYYLLHLSSYVVEDLDLSKVKFGKYWPGVPHYKLEEDYGHISKQLLTKLWDELAGSLYVLMPVGHYYFKSFVPANWDMFKIGEFDSSIMVSERFKQKMEDAGLTGFYFSASDLYE